jgi:hypothetical protein
VLEQDSLDQKPELTRVSTSMSSLRLCGLLGVLVCSQAVDGQDNQANKLPPQPTAGSAAPSPSQAASASADGAGNRVLEFHYTPVSNAQVALWIEDAAGKFLSTVALTEAVATRGIGNRPGASQMNSGFRWPYGRREGVLPIWAHRRLSAPGAKPFRRVIFQKRTSEGLASRTSEDYSRDDYFCLSFNNSASRKDALDAVSCASLFNSDKGRFITGADVSAAYAEPYEDVTTHVGRLQPLTLDSAYPPRRDIKPCAAAAGSAAGCYESPDVATYDDHVHDVMPEIDEVSMATPKGNEPQQRIFSVPAEWPDGEYNACIEVNVEGDYNAAYDERHFPTPTTPSMSWDSWATGFGYPYRGQPSVVYCAGFELRNSSDESVYTAAEAEGTTGTWDTATNTYGALGGMDGMSDDPVAAPGSGGDRLQRDGQGNRFLVTVKPSVSCEDNMAPGAVADMALKPYPNALEAHEWAELDFRAAKDDKGVFRYDVRVSTDPIVDDDSFMRGDPAKSATTAAEALRVPTDMPPGAEIAASLGGLSPQTHYYVGVRAVDGCATVGPIEVAEITTEKRVFATVTPCFVATAAYGTPMAAEISALRRFRDRHLANQALGRAFVEVYGNVGPKLANIIRRSDALRAVSRILLAPAVAFARLLSD